MEQKDYDEMHSFRHVLNRHFFKFFLGLLGMIAAGFLVAYGTNYYSNLKKYNAEVKKQEAAKEETERIRKLYAEDTYGGYTPEETLALFIDALNKGNADLAAKYFVLDKQKEWTKNLQKIKELNQLELMAKDLVKPKEKKVVSDSQIVFYIYNNLKQLAVAINFARGPNGIWKILDL